MFQIYGGLVLASALALPLSASSVSMSPDAMASQKGYANCTVAKIADSPSTPDGAWCAVGTPEARHASPAEVRVTFPTPAATLTTGANLQEFRVLLRKTTQPKAPSCSLDLYENDERVVGAVAMATAVTSTNGVVLSGTWDAEALSHADGSGVEARVHYVLGGGPRSDRAVGEVGAIEWIAEYAAVPSRSFNRLIVGN